MSNPSAADVTATAERLRSLGHIPLRQGPSYDCPRCGRTGLIVDGRVLGDIGKQRCES
jgi:hypothetical protein